ncbi:MAG: type II secretion system protein GspL [Pseudomonadota bacterium]|nr:type II secretion system protein GspL [Pseudomonadota bacterium]
MSEELLIRCGLGGLRTARCRLDGESIALEQSIGRLTHGESDITLLLDSRDVLLTTAELPTRGRRKARAAAPFAVEEQVAADLDMQFVTLGPRSGHSFAVAVVARQRLENLLDELAQLGIAVRRVIPDVLALPLEEGRWTVAECADALLVRCGPMKGFSCDLVSAGELLGAAVAAETPPPAVLAIGRFATFDIDAWAAAQGVDLKHRDEQAAVLTLFDIDVGDSMDLLPDDLRPVHPLGRRWMYAATVLLLATVVLHLTNLSLERRELNRQAEALQRAVEASFLAVAPAGAPVHDPLGQLTRLAQEVERGPARGNLLALLADLTTALNEQSVGTGTLAVTSLRFQHGEAELTMTGGSAAQIEALARSLSRSAERIAKVVSTTSVAGGTEGRLLVTPR